MNRVRKQLKDEKAEIKPPDIAARVVSIIALLLSLLTFFFNYFKQGNLKVFAPATYCIVRGYKDIGFPSDHLIVPLTMENTGNGVKTFQSPVLKLTELTNKRVEQDVEFVMVGTVPDLYGNTLDKAYQVGFSIAVPKNEVGEYYLTFHIKNWWDKSQPEYNEFHFKSGEKWRVSLVYLMNGKEMTWQDGGQQELFTMSIYETIDRLEYGENYNSDCFPTENYPSH